MKIGILGFGSVGQKLAKLFSEAGHEVTIGTHKSSLPEDVSYPHANFEQTAASSEVIVLAIPYSACVEVLPSLAKVLANKIVIDNTNPLNDDWSPLLLGEENSAGETIDRMLPQSHVVKAFNTIFADVMQSDRIVRDGMRITAFVCGDDAESKQVVLRLVKECGFAPLDVGPLRNSRYLEGMAHLNIHIAIAEGGGTNAAFLYHQICG